MNNHFSYPPIPTKAARQLDEAIRTAWQALYRRYADLLDENNSDELATRLTEVTTLIEDQG
jgi:hypothetical protein